MNSNHDLATLAAYSMQLNSALCESKLFTACQKLTQDLRLLLNKVDSNFYDNDEGIFSKQIIYRILEELLGCIGCLKEGAFRASRPHMRALLELFATTVLIDNDSKNNNKKKYLKRFNRFDEIEYYKIYHKHNDAIVDLPEKNLLKPFEELHDELLSIFNKKTKEELLKMKSWTGNCKITQLVNQLTHQKVELKNYRILCLFVHCSPLIKYSTTHLFREFNTTEEEMLGRTIAYVLHIFTYLKERKFADECIIKQFSDVFFSVAGTLTPIVKNLVI